MARDLLTDFELMILLAVLRAGDEAYGVAIARDIELETTSRTVLLGAVYAALEAGWNAALRSASAMGEPTAARGGRAKRYFRIRASRPACRERHAEGPRGPVERHSRIEEEALDERSRGHRSRRFRSSRSGATGTWIFLSSRRCPARSRAS